MLGIKIGVGAFERQIFEGKTLVGKIGANPEFIQPKTTFIVCSQRVDAGESHHVFIIGDDITCIQVEVAQPYVIEIKDSRMTGIRLGRIDKIGVGKLQLGYLNVIFGGAGIVGLLHLSVILVARRKKTVIERAVVQSVQFDSKRIYLQFVEVVCVTPDTKKSYLAIKFAEMQQSIILKVAHKYALHHNSPTEHIDKKPRNLHLCA